jgi:hypothetical protein
MNKKKSCRDTRLKKKIVPQKFYTPLPGFLIVRPLTCETYVLQTLQSTILLESFGWIGLQLLEIFQGKLRRPSSGS